MRKILKIFLFLPLLLNGCAIADNEPNGTPESYDVNDVRIQGDSTLMGMKIESLYFADGAFLVETTGARFEYTKGELKLYQGLGKANRRLVSKISFENEPNFTKVEDNNDHILFWSKDLNIGIYGDSTLIVSPKVNQNLKCNGNFKPDYEGRYKGELLLIDDKGGMEIYPQRYEKGYEVKKIELGKIDWVADYELNVGERVMIAAFPGRPFDWEKSFKSNLVLTCGGMGYGSGNPYGQMPSNHALKIWSGDFNIVSIFFHGLYKSKDQYGPYEIANSSEFRRLIASSHEYGMKVCVYTSLYYWAHKRRNFEDYFLQIKKLKNDYEIDGVYIDGLTFDGGIYYKDDNKIMNLEMVRRIRELFGNNGVIIYHGTTLGITVASVPNIDAYCDIAYNGEAVKFQTLEDDYINYHVRKYGISNTIAIWITGPHPKNITRRQIIDKILQMNGRELVGQFVYTDRVPPTGGKYEWPTWLNMEYDYYLMKMQALENTYRKNPNALDFTNPVWKLNKNGQ